MFIYMNSHGKYVYPDTNPMDPLELIFLSLTKKTLESSTRIGV